MGCVVIYPAPKGCKTLWHLVKGQLDGRPCRWTVNIWYDVENLEPDEMNPRSITIRVNKPIWLKDLMGEIDRHMNGELAKGCGKITNIKWRAIQGR